MWLLVLPVKPVNPESGPKCLVCVTQRTRRFRKCSLCLAISRFFITLFLLQFVVDVAVLQGFPQWVGWENVTGFRSTVSIPKATHPFFNIVNKFSTYALSLLRRLMFTLKVTYNFSKN